MDYIKPLFIFNCVDYLLKIGFNKYMNYNLKDFMYQKIYCVYLTTYRGNKLPPFYIGSTSLDKIQKGYRGSVSSKQYKNIWNEELKNNPHLFHTKVISKFDTQKESIARELFLHIQLCVVKNDLYMNKSEARKNGFFGTKVYGKDHPSFGKPRTDVHQKGMLGKKHTEETKKNMSLARQGRTKKPHTDETKLIMREAKVGIPLSAEHKQKMSDSHKGKIKSDEHKQNISASHKGKPKTEAHRQNINMALEKVRAERKSGVRDPIKPRSEESKKTVREKHKNMPDLTCPHCNKTGGHSGMLSWHFNNCKFKLKEIVK